MKNYITLKSLRAIGVCLGVASTVSLVGCAGVPKLTIDQAQQLVRDNGGSIDSQSDIVSIDQYLRPDYLQSAKTDKRNSVLHHLRIGLSAIHSGNTQLATRSFDAALLVIETVYGNDATAAKARGTFNAEKDKVFRGDPYERAMAYYYRGILYLLEDDFENARASFRSGFLQDSLAGSEVYQQDFALLAYLEGWASQCNGDNQLAEQAFALAKKYNSNITLPANNATVLVVAEHGNAPIKYTEGEHNELLKIKASDTAPDGNFYVKQWDGHQKLPNTESISWQAITRGGREFDAILAGKVNFKEGAENVSGVAGAVSAVSAVSAVADIAASGLLDNVGDSLGLGLFSGLISSAAKSAAKATKPAADTRMWNTLPDSVHYGVYHPSEVTDVLYGSYGLQETDSGAQAVFQSDKTSAENLAIQRGGNNCKVILARFSPTKSTAESTQVANNIPAFMRQVDGCWKWPGIPSFYYEIKIVSNNVMLLRVEKKNIYYKHDYKITNESAQKWEWLWGKAYFVNKDEIDVKWHTNLHRASPKKCRGLYFE